MAITDGNVDQSIRITQLYLYPIKSLRPTKISTTQFTKHGFPYDRTFMLLQDNGPTSAPSKRYRNMSVAEFPAMTQFHTAVRYPTADAPGAIEVTHAPTQRALTVPLTPDTAALAPTHVDMHGSATPAFDMGDACGAWFSARFGFAVRLLYIGGHSRAVLFPSAAGSAGSDGSWLSGLTTTVSSLLGGAVAPPEPERIAFHDCAPYLVVTQRSCDAVSAWLPDGEDMDITKFRPNVVLDGGGCDPAWDEDFWGEVAICGDGGAVLVVPLLQNCIRCQSLNIDFATGKPGTGKAGEVLKMLQKTRRVDKGKKYHAVFGRYGYLKGEAGTVSIGDEVRVTKRNEERTAFGELA